MKKAVTKKPVDKNKKLLSEVASDIESRIADGGATTDQLQTILHKINPKAPASAVATVL